jgi:hypothetical protein
MNNRGITWACSRCGARFSTKEDLDAHVAGHKDGGVAPSAPPDVVITPSAPVVRPIVGGISQIDAGLGRRPSADATRVPAGEKPIAQPLPRRLTPARATHVSRWVVLATVCVAAVALGIAFPHQIAHQIALGVTKQPTPFTELYFSNPSGLPRSLSLSGPNAFSFTVVNHEGHDDAYSYAVTLASAHGSSAVARGRLQLRNGMRASMVVNVLPDRPNTEYLITVNLTGQTGQTEMIHFRGVSQ